MMSLIQRDGPLVPGGYSYTDPRTGRKFEGMAITFMAQCKLIREHRLANPRVYSPADAKYFNLEFIGQELDAAICNRLGNNPKYCVDDQAQAIAAAAAATPPAPRLCPKCSKPMEPILCKTCRGHKIKGYRCPACGLQTR